MKINFNLFKRSCPKCGNGLIKKNSWKEWVSAYEGTFLVSTFVCLKCDYIENVGKETTDFFQWLLHFLF